MVNLASSLVISVIEQIDILNEKIKQINQELDEKDEELNRLYEEVKSMTEKYEKSKRILTNITSLFVSEPSVKTYLGSFPNDIDVDSL